MKRFGFILSALAIAALAGVAIAEVGHITPVGHVDTVQLDWQTIESDDVFLHDGASFSFLPQDEAPTGTGELGTLQLPEDKAYNLSMLGGIEATLGLDSASAQGAPIEARGISAIISGDLQIPNQNMLLLFNEATQKWDGYNDFSFSIGDGSSYDIAAQADAVKIRVIGARATEASSGGGGGGGGGCSAAFLAPAALFLLAPLFVLRKRR